MRRPYILAMVLFFVGLSCAGAARSEQAQWVGRFLVDGKATVLVVNVRQAASETTVDLPTMGHANVPAPGVRIGEGDVRFALTLGPDRVVFIGKRVRSRVVGDVRHGLATGSFELERVVAADSRVLAAHAGSYDFGNGRIVDIGPMDEIGGQLVYLDQPGLGIGVLQARSDTDFVSGPSLGIPYPFARQVRFVRDETGATTAIEWHEGDATRVARRVSPHRRETVSIRNGDIVLVGDLLLPSGPGPHPAIVLAHGSGDTARNVGAWNLFFVRQGFAVLSLDKRGVGESGGDWRTASLDDIAGDWLAGVALLRARADIDPRRIGVHGSSQGGWTAPLMASRSKDIAFLVVRAGSGLPVLDTMAYEVGWSVREAGFGRVEQVDAEAAARDLFGLAAQRADWPDFDVAAARYRDKPWANAAWPVQMSEDGWGRTWTALNAGIDNAQALRALRIPVLWFLADEDHNVPADASEKRLRAAFSAAGNPDATIVRIAHAGHAFTATATGDNRDFATQTHMAAGYWESMAVWLRARGFSQ